MSQQNRVAVVTGGSRGIGASVARRLARDGAAVAVLYRVERTAADAVVDSIHAAGGNAAAFQVDVREEGPISDVARAVAARFGEVNILVNSAGIFDAAPAGEIPYELFQRQFAVNTWSVVNVTQAVLPHFAESGGSIVNVSTSLVHQPGDGTAVYAASKAAVEVLTRGFAMELGHRGIRVNAVAPHITRTDMTAGIPPAELEAQRRLTPLGRLAEPEDISDVVAFLVSNQARWITGRTILTDGGRT
jgi:3-oxoacyl-[acyl-carrier protein] reductase